MNPSVEKCAKLEQLLDDLYDAAVITKPETMCSFQNMKYPISVKHTFEVANGLSWAKYKKFKRRMCEEFDFVHIERVCSSSVIVISYSYDTP